MSFTTDTAISKEGEIYKSEIKPGWDIHGNANGGYLMAIGARAMAAASRPPPRLGYRSFPVTREGWARDHYAQNHQAGPYLQYRKGQCRGAPKTHY